MQITSIGLILSWTLENAVSYVDQPLPAVSSSTETRSASHVKSYFCFVFFFSFPSSKWTLPSPPTPTIAQASAHGPFLHSSSKCWDMILGISKFILMRGCLHWCTQKLQCSCIEHSLDKPAKVSMSFGQVKLMHVIKGWHCKKKILLYLDFGVIWCKQFSLLKSWYQWLPKSSA